MEYLVERRPLNKLQATLNEAAKDGWRAHTIITSGLGQIGRGSDFVIVFERERQAT